MKHELVHRYTCEGCGAECVTDKEIAKFGAHMMRGPLWPGTVNSEEECIARMARYRERDRWLAERRAQLVEICSQDETFKRLTGMFPDEHGDGDDAVYFRLRVRCLIEEIFSDMTLGDFTGLLADREQALLSDCIAAARAAAVETKAAERG